VGYRFDASRNIPSFARTLGSPAYTAKRKSVAAKDFGLRRENIAMQNSTDPERQQDFARRAHNPRAKLCHGREGSATLCI
jgi:hypothetical protein